jgi:hypothetical protein
MSFIHNNALAGASGQGGAYEIEQSLRFNNAQLSRTPSSAGNRRTFTFSIWLKRSEISAIGGFFSAFSSIEQRDVFRFDSSDEFRIFFNETTSGNIFSNAKHRDTSAWYHFVVAVDTTQATAADRVKVWINGESVSFRSASYPAQNTNLNVNNTVAHYVGHSYLQTDQEWQGYLAEFHLVDGTALDHEDFGELDDNGVWRPIEVSGLTYGTNGFYLKFDPTATNGIGHDHSGNGNNFSPTGFTTSGTGTDVMSDTPTTNWCTLNRLKSTSASITNGNLDFSNGAVDQYLSVGTIGVTSGKWYWETTKTGGSNGSTGIAQDSVNTNRYVGQSADSWGYVYVGTKANNATQSAYGNSYTNNDVIGVAFDADAGSLYFYKNGVAQNSGTAAYTGLTSGP